MNELVHEQEESFGARRRALSHRIVRIADPLLTTLASRWLLLVNAAVLLFITGAVAAPLLLASDLVAPANALYDFYAAICHQWAFRTFFLFGPQPVYARSELLALGADSYTFVGNAALGWKMAFCERDFAIFSGLLLFGVLYAGRWRRGNLPPATFFVYALLITPMAIDGFTQLLGSRESTWELRVATGLLFGLASGWLLYPRFHWSIQRGLRA